PGGIAFKTGKAIVPCDLVHEQRVLELRTPAAIVHDHGPAGWCKLIGHDCDVCRGGSVLRPVIRDDVARLIVLCKLRNWQHVPVPCQEASNNFDTTVIDIAVSGAASCLLDQDLKVDADLTVSSNDDVGAHAKQRRDISHRIADANVLR